MNVCLLNDSFPPVIDGVANVVKNYADIMTEKELANVIVGTPKYHDGDYKNYPYPVIPYQSFKVKNMANGYRAGNPFCLSKLNKFVEFEPDIIHSHCPFASTVLARLVREATHVPIVFTYHTKFDVDIANTIKSELIQKETINAIVRNISACDEVWAVSKGAGENLKSLGYEGEYRVVSNGVDFEKGRIDEKTVAKVTAGFDLPEDIPVFLFVGRLHNYKGLPMIADAMIRLTEAGVDYRMIFIGKGPDAAGIQEKIKQAGITLDIPDDEADEGSRTYKTIEGRADRKGRVLFVGPIHDRNVLRAWNTRADLFLFPSTYDTNGLVVREAAACGLASVLVKDSCASEGITDGRNGYMIEENAESMAALLGRVSGDLSALHDVGQHAMDEIYISWESAVRDAHSRYEEIIDMKYEKDLDRFMEHRRKHRQLSDNFFELADDFLESTNRFFDRRKEFYEGMEENFYEAFHDIGKAGRTVADEVKKIGEHTKSNIEAAEEKAASDWKETKDKIREALKDNKG